MVNNYSLKIKRYEIKNKTLCIFRLDSGKQSCSHNERLYETFMYSIRMLVQLSSQKIKLYLRPALFVRETSALVSVFDICKIKFYSIN